MWRRLSGGGVEIAIRPSLVQSCWAQAVLICLISFGRDTSPEREELKSLSDPVRPCQVCDVSQVFRTNISCSVRKPQLLT